MASNFEKLDRLCKENYGILSRLDSIKRRYKNEETQPSCFKNPTYAGIRRLVARSFEKFSVEKDKGYEDLKNNSKVIIEELDDDFSTFVDAMAFAEIAEEELKHIFTGTFNLQFHVNTDIMVKAFDLLVGFVRLHLFIRTVGVKKTLLGLHHAAFKSQSQSGDPRYLRLVEYINKYEEKPLRVIKESFRHISDQVGGALLSLKDIYEKIMKKNNFQSFRSNAIFDMLENPENMAMPATDDIYLEVTYVGAMHSWILLGLMVCPEVLGGKKKDDALELLMSALENDYMFPVFREEAINIHGEWEAHIEFLRKKHPEIELSVKHKKVASRLRDVERGAIENGGKVHRSRRCLMRVALQQMVMLTQQCPGLLGPKFPMILSMLSFARYEVETYYMHRHAEPRSKGWGLLSKAPIKPKNDYEDIEMATLLSLCDTQRNLCQEHFAIIERYFIEYVSGPHNKFVSNLTGAISSYPKINKAFQAVLEEMSMMKPGQHFKCAKLRAKWLQASGIIGEWGGSKGSKQDLQSLMRRMDIVVQQSRYIDSMPTLFVEFASLRNLWWYIDQVQGDFKTACSHQSGDFKQASSAIAFVRILHAATENTNEYCPNDREWIGKTAVATAQSFLKSLAIQIVKSLNYLNEKLQKLDGLATIISASKFKTSDVHFPGFESKPELLEIVLDDQSQGEKLREIQRSFHNMRSGQLRLFRLCASLAKSPYIYVYDHELCTVEYFREALFTAFDNFIITEGSKLAGRPIELHHRVHTYIHTISHIASHIGFDATVIIQDLMQKHAGFSDSEEELKNPSISRFGEVKLKGDTLVGIIASRFRDLISKSMLSTVDDLKRGVGWSNVYEAIVHWHLSSKTRKLDVEICYSVSSLKYIVSLIGPIGVRVVCSHILTNIVVPRVEEILVILHSNKSLLNQFNHSFMLGNDDLITLATNMSNLKRLMELLITVGAAFHIRKMFMDALQQTSDEYVPLLYHACGAAKEGLQGNGHSKLIELGQSMGYHNSRDYDRQLVHVFNKMTVKKEMLGSWSSLPLAVAAIYASDFWKQASNFNTRINVFSNNAQHSALAVNTLLSCLPYCDDIQVKGDTMDAVKAAQRLLVKSTVTMLLQMKNVEHDRYIRHYPLRTMFQLLQMTVDTLEFVEQSYLEQFLPYRLIHFALTDIKCGRQAGIDELQDITKLTRQESEHDEAPRKEVIRTQDTADAAQSPTPNPDS